MASFARAILASPDSLLSGAFPVLSAQDYRLPISAAPAMTIVAPANCQKEMERGEATNSGQSLLAGRTFRSWRHHLPECGAPKDVSDFPLNIRVLMTSGDH